jgi:hypothetical protein
MKVRRDAFVLAISFVAIAVGFPALAADVPTRLAGTSWFKWSECAITMLDFYDRGIARSETGDDATWTLVGNQLTIKWPEPASDTLVGTLEGGEFRATHSWIYENKPGSETCLFKKDLK